MIPNILEQQIVALNKAHIRWQIAFAVLFLMGFAWWLYNQYKQTKLQNTWYAMNILQARKELNTDISAKEAVNEALKGDGLVTVVQKFNMA